MAVFSKIISIFVSFFMAILNLFGLGVEEEPKFVLGENVNSNAAQVLEIYNAAVIKTDEDAPLTETEINFSSFSWSGISFSEQVIKSIFNETVYEDYEIPGEGLLAADDVVSAKSSTENGKTTVIIEVKDQTDGFDADAYTAGPVSKAVGTLGSIEGALDLLGVELLSGEDTIELAYTNCTVACIIDDATGEIIAGEWSYDVCLTIEYAEFLADDTSIPVENLVADLTFTTTL